MITEKRVALKLSVPDVQFHSQIRWQVWTWRKTNKVTVVFCFGFFFFADELCVPTGGGGMAEGFVVFNSVNFHLHFTSLTH